jgi:hypothetical protein
MVVSSTMGAGGGVVGTATTLLAGRSGVGIAVGAKGFPLLKNVQTSSMCTWVLTRDGRGMKLTHIHLVPMLILSGATPL